MEIFRIRSGCRSSGEKRVIITMFSMEAQLHSKYHLPILYTFLKYIQDRKFCRAV